MVKADEANSSISRSIEKTVSLVEAKNYDLQLAVQPSHAIDAAKGNGALAGALFVVDDSFLLAEGSTRAVGKMLQEYSSPVLAEAIEKLTDKGAVCLGQTKDMSSLLADEAATFGLEIASPVGSFARGLKKDTFSLKPTYGAISRYGTVVSSSSMDTISVVAKSSTIAREVLIAAGGIDEKDMSSRDINFAAEELPSGLKLGVLGPLDSSLDSQLDAVRALGYPAVEVKLPSLQYADQATSILAAAETSSNLARFDGVRYGQRAISNSLDAMYQKSRSEGLSDELKFQIMLGNYVLSSKNYERLFVQAARLRTKLKKEVAAIFSEVDILINPASPSNQGQNSSNLSMFLGLPSLRFMTDDDRGLELIAPQAKDTDLITFFNLLKENQS